MEVVKVAMAWVGGVFRQSFRKLSWPWVCHSGWYRISFQSLFCVLIVYWMKSTEAIGSRAYKNLVCFCNVILQCDSAMWFCNVILQCDSAKWFCKVILQSDSATWFYNMLVQRDFAMWICNVAVMVYL